MSTNADRVLFNVFVAAVGTAAGVLLVRSLRKGRGAPMSRRGSREDRGDFVPSPGGPGAVILPRASDPRTTQRIQSLAALLDKVWPDVTGRPGPMPIAAKEIALAQAAAEGTGYGQGWSMVGNVGSYQCGGAQTGTGYYDCVPHTDSRPDPQGGPNKEYTTTFRSYKDGVTPDGKSRSALEAGAWDFLTSITVKPFPAIDEMLAGDLLGYARKQYGQHYFEGFNLSADGLAAYRASVDKLLAGGVPVRRQGETPERVAGRIVYYAAAMARNLPTIVAALGAPRASSRVASDLTIPWKNSYQARPGVA